MPSLDLSRSRPLIGIVANEPSGDQLGALLVQALRERRPELRFIGVAGPKMLAAGCETLLPMERLSVMGLVEVAKVLPDLLRARRDLVRGLQQLNPLLVIGVDAPDFNLGLERRLRARGIPTVHLVSPTVWAWRPGRVKQIRRSVDLMLSIFPFEADFLREHRVPVTYIGHPLADDFPLQPDREAACRALGISLDSLVAVATDPSLVVQAVDKHVGVSNAPSAEDSGVEGPTATAAAPKAIKPPASKPQAIKTQASKPCEESGTALIAILPGSRRSEVELLGRPMLETAAWCHRRRPGLRFIAPMVSEALRQRFEAMRCEMAPQLPLKVVNGQSREAMAAADLVLTASGTATLEALLSKRPMLVAYRLHPLTYWLVTRLRLIKVRYAAMANLLVGRELAPEFLQGRCRADLMGPALLALLDDAERRAEIDAAYREIHRELRQNAAHRAAEAILALIDRAGDHRRHA
ncbi:lipid-A-disaccharide synthase [Lamprobacter modestohalophilus]|uniref:Lipid-A-disaccharide synthase n=1 Tax=Lamprobacter modestohalophilus TaxID=1064514 RepID=A0A9X0WBQ0_9GAMM|nr:lipid-A-disaccharide synthase [Lamprobacter modestohalophilus]